MTLSALVLCADGCSSQSDYLVYEENVEIGNHYVVLEYRERNSELLLLGWLRRKGCSTSEKEL